MGRQDESREPLEAALQQVLRRQLADAAVVDADRRQLGPAGVVADVDHPMPHLADGDIAGPDHEDPVDVASTRELTVPMPAACL